MPLNELWNNDELCWVCSNFETGSLSSSDSDSDSDSFDSLDSSNFKLSGSSSDNSTADHWQRSTSPPCLSCRRARSLSPRMRNRRLCKVEIRSQLHICDTVWLVIYWNIDHLYCFRSLMLHGSHSYSLCILSALQHTPASSSTPQRNSLLLWPYILHHHIFFALLFPLIALMIIVSIAFTYYLFLFISSPILDLYPFDSIGVQAWFKVEKKDQEVIVKVLFMDQDGRCVKILFYFGFYNILTLVFSVWILSGTRRMTMKLLGFSTNYTYMK